MCSTAYGGSAEMTRMWGKSDADYRIQRHDFHIQGAADDLNASVRGELDKFVAQGAATYPTTVVFVEVPTNPDMKVPDVNDLAAACLEYRHATGKRVLLLVDVTFAPGSEALKKIQQVAPDLMAMAFVSMSKSVSRGLTTAGALVCNHMQESKELLQAATAACRMLDVGATPDQLRCLVHTHGDVVDRCQRAYDVARRVGDSLKEAVYACTGINMPLGFVTPEQAALGFTSSTFSFCLPPRPGSSRAEREALAQSFVDGLCAHPEFKPCVSFGQDNGLVYATVPATSTQGAIKPEDKAKQAVDGVQLVRLSFPASCDVQALCKIVSESCAKVYITGSLADL
jgi:cysteine synthase A